MKKLWNYLNGKKTLIFMTAVAIMDQAIQFEILPDSDKIKFIISILALLGGFSWGHKAKKAYNNKRSIK